MDRALRTALALLLPFGFINCSEPKVTTRGEKQVQTRGNGDIYLGRVYNHLQAGVCPDGSDLVASLRFVSFELAALTYDNCAPLPQSIDIPADQIQKMPGGDQVIVNNRVFTRDPDLVINGSFEEGLTWFEVLGGDPVMTSDSYSGASAISTRSSSSWSWWQQGLAPTLWKPGQDYLLSAAGKVTAGTNPIQVVIKGSTGELARLTFNSAVYERKEIRFTAPSGLTWTIIYVSMENTASSAATVDALSVVPLP